VIYAIPYTSIIEQTADVFRQVFAELGEVVVEHHSQAEADEREDTARSRLACENWDAPLIVTTNVQLFESLFAARTSRCRKLHNLVGSVIVLTKPSSFRPSSCNRFSTPPTPRCPLRRHRRACTATQPALGTTHFFGNNLRGLDNIRPIIAKPDALFTQLQRVRVHLPADMNTPTPWPAIAAQIAECDSVLAIVNTRKQARELHRLLPAGTLHLSNRMCGAHKARVIQEIKTRLKAKRAGEDIRPLRIVSTSLIEAGSTWMSLSSFARWPASTPLQAAAAATGRTSRRAR
jgi:CRISPR-associated endonuclease/helicase Cas3